MNELWRRHLCLPRRELSFRRLAVETVCLLVVVPALLSAGQPWKKDSSKWSEADVQRILTASPWAESVSVIFPDPERDFAPQMPLPGPEQAGMGTRGNTASRDWDGGVAKHPKNIPGVPKLSVLVRWESARPVQQAEQKFSKPRPVSDDAEDFDKDYVITVVGLVRGGSYQEQGTIAPKSATSESGDAGNTSDRRNPERMLEGLMEDSMIATDSGLAIRPENVKLDADTGALHFFFPRKRTIVVGDKEAVFETKFSSMTIKKRFRLKDMVYQGKLDL